MKTNVAIVGVGETRYERRTERSLLALELDAARAAIADAGLAARDIDGLVAPGAGYAELHELARNLGLGANFFHADSLHSGSAVVSSPLLASMAIANGLATTVLCVKGVRWGSERKGDVGRPHAEMRMKAAFELPAGWYPQIVHFAGMARRHMELYGTREEDLAEVAVAFRGHALRCDNALLRKPWTIAEHLAAPYLAEPLRAADCCLVNDGAAAFVMTSVERARDLPRSVVRVLGVGQGVSADGEFSTLRANYLATPVAAAAPRAYTAAGIGAADVDFVELYDNFSSMALTQLEDLGFCARGEGGAFVRGGRIALDGALPVNTAGGQLAQSFVLAGNLVVEAVRQLRGECGARQVKDAQIGAVTGYTGAQSAVAILART